MSYFLASDQHDNRIRIFPGESNAKDGLFGKSIWHNPALNQKSFLRPTDAKRVDLNGKIKIIIATHGYISEVPFRFRALPIIATSYQSCHSVERMPDGNLISANSKHGMLSIHFNPIRIYNVIILRNKIDVPLHFAHGVVYDKKRKYLWAIGTILNKYKYKSGPIPSLELIKSYALPHPSGHDLFPDNKDNLLLTVNTGIYLFDIEREAFQEISDLKRVKSVVQDIHTDDLYITEPKTILGYARWQTHTIQNLTTQKRYKRPRGRFYKVRLWQPNTFSY